MSVKYRDTVLAELARHGVSPRDETPPEFIHEFINDLYRYEIRRLRARLLAGEIEKQKYAAHVERLRDRYPILSLPVRYWREGEM
ncbi:MAG: hypothetical protein WBV94_08950 [Blastocatellia bacterium]